MNSHYYYSSSRAFPYEQGMMANNHVAIKVFPYYFYFGYQ